MNPIKTFELNQEQTISWKEIFDPWFYTNFRNCLKTHDFKMDCIDCGNILMDVEININAFGKVENFNIINRDFDCANKTDEQLMALESCMLKYFVEWTYPENLRNIFLEIRIGEVTKC